MLLICLSIPSFIHHYLIVLRPQPPCTPLLLPRTRLILIPPKRYEGKLGKVLSSCLYQDRLPCSCMPVMRKHFFPPPLVGHLPAGMVTSFCLVTSSLFFVREFWSGNKSWLLVGSITVLHGAQIAGFVSANKARLRKSLLWSYVKLQGIKTEFGCFGENNCNCN